MFVLACASFWAPFIQSCGSNVGPKRKWQKQGGLRVGGGAKTWPSQVFVHLGSWPAGSMRRRLQQSFEIMLCVHCGLLNRNFTTENPSLLFSGHPFRAALCCSVCRLTSTWGTLKHTIGTNARTHFTPLLMGTVLRGSMSGPKQIMQPIKDRNEASRPQDCRVGDNRTFYAAAPFFPSFFFPLY